MRPVLVDLRAFPGSRKFPDYSKGLMPDWLDQAGITYHHLPKLGGSKDQLEVVDHDLGKWGAIPIIEADGTVMYPKLST